MAKFEIKDGVAIIPEGTTEIEVSAYSDEMSWVEAIRKVLVEAGVPMHYKDITRTIIEKKYRLNFGDTPERTVSNRLTTNPNLFKRVEIGVYELVETSVTDEMSWVEAIRKVLVEAGAPMDYNVITDKIIAKKYRTAYGKTPERSVNKCLTTNPDLFKRVEEGVYELVKTSVTDEINWDDIDWNFDDIDWDVDVKDDESNYKKASSFIKSTVPSPLERELLELIVNFPLPLGKDEVCFAEILDDIEVEFSNEEKKRHQSIDKALLEKKLDELKKQIEEIERKAMQDHRFGDLHGALLWRMRYAAKRAQGLLDEVSGYIVEFQIEPLGEFIPGKGEEKPKVVIYNENIQKSIKDIVWIYASWQVMPAVFVHEMFHAWNYFKARRNSRSVLAIDEPMVEFETLYFLKNLYDYTVLQSHHLHKEVESVRKNYKDIVLYKQQSIGDVAAYGFGHYLFENLNDDDSKKWIEAYSEKSASINGDNQLVMKAKDALIPIYPFKSEEKLMNWFRKIIFNRQTTCVTAGKYAGAKVGLHVSLRDLVLACIETIGRKCFDAQELYAFMPIFTLCVPQCQNLEEALKQQLDELVKDGVLDALPNDCYSMKLASVEVKPKRPVSTPATTTKSKKAPSIAFTVEFPDDNVKFDEKNAIKTYIESLKYIGLRRVQSVGIMKNGYNLVSDVERPPEGGNKWQDYVDSKYIYTKLGNQEKKAYLYQIADKLGINIKISDI